MKTFEAFMSRVRGRMNKGAREYGDRSFSEHPSLLVAEIQEELQDVCGWGFILWTRLEQIKAALERVEPVETEDERTEKT